MAATRKTTAAAASKTGTMTLADLPRKTGLVISEIGGEALAAPQFATVYLKGDQAQVVYGLAQGEEKAHAFLLPASTSVVAVVDPTAWPEGTRGARWCSNEHRHEGQEKQGPKGWVRYLRAHGDNNVTAYCDCRKVREAANRAKKAAEAGTPAKDEAAKAAADRVAEAKAGAEAKAEAPKPKAPAKPKAPKVEAPKAEATQAA